MLFSSTRGLYTATVKFVSMSIENGHFLEVYTVKSEILLAIG